MEISGKKPGFSEIVPVAQKPGIWENLGWVAKYLERNPVSLRFSHGVGVYLACLCCERVTSLFPLPSTSIY
ncbi:hypothetical protein QUB68_18255 [Microcoleus sp. A006_D1]|uniref:hypothetical protein n=1 Tax=Microcoleus sp. A006_D1 TaxID=3055267 RepID=UPI002FD5D4EB